ncbi:MAG: succinate dehydrogenase iron-sulfur subunit [Anaerolineales bacterium]|nr:succinate dehydrogenase iron-sulfur subunit [Anaerolineales bacterium]
MSTNTSNTAIVRVQRFNPDDDKKPYIQEYSLAVTRDTTILDALHEIKTHQDGGLTFRRSCRHAICGSCAMNVNGKNMLVCNTPINHHLDGKGRVTIRPLPYLPVIKDLVVDRTSFWEQYLRVKPWLIPLENVPDKEYRMSPAEVAALNDAEKCIMCGACYSACTVVGTNKKYIGPHALLKAFLRVLDPRDAGVDERLQEVGTGEGVYRCHTIFNCIDACPKNLDPTKAIETLRGLAAKRQAYEASKQARQQTLTEPVPVKE